MIQLCQRDTLSVTFDALIEAGMLDFYLKSFYCETFFHENI